MFEPKQSNIYLSPSFIETQRKKGIMNNVLADFIGTNIPEVNSELQQIRQKYGKDNEKAVASYLDYKIYGDPNPVERFVPEEAQPVQTGIDYSDPANPKNRQFNPINKFIGRIGNRIETAGEGVQQSLSDYQTGKQGAIQTGVQTAAQIGSGIMSPATEAIGTVTSEAMRTTGVDKAIAAGAQSFAGTDIGQNAIQTAKGLYDSAAENFPQELRTAETVGKVGLDALDIATVGFGKKAAMKGGEVLTSKIDDAAKAAAAARIIQSADKVDNTILEGMKAVRPSSAGKRAASDLVKFDDNSILAVKSIITNKAKLRLVDEFGEAVTEQLPQNVRQFADSIEQTRGIIYNQYDNLAKQAGEAGAQVDLKGVANEVIDAITDPRFVSLEDQAPEIADYLLKRATVLEKRGFYTAEQAQQAVKNYNATLKSFYSNPTYENYAKASIDAMIANNLRKGLDDVIENLTGAEYSALKKQYGALKAIEADVVKRAVVDARKNAKGLLDFTDVLTGGNLLTGLLTFNPAQAAKGGFGIAIKNYLKMLNDPNRNIRNMFRKSDALLQAIPDGAVDAAKAAAKKGVQSVDNIDDLPLSSFSPQGVKDAAKMDELVKGGMTAPEAAKKLNQVDDFANLTPEEKAVSSLPKTTEVPPLPDATASFPERMVSYNASTNKTTLDLKAFADKAASYTDESGVLRRDPVMANKILKEWKAKNGGSAALTLPDNANQSK